MRNRIFISSLFFASFLVMPINSGVAAALECDPHFEMLTKLHHPVPGSYTVWDSLYGEGQKDEKFVSVLNKGDGGVLAVGEMRTMPQIPPSLMFVHFDRRGRVIWDKYHSISGLREVVKMLPNDNSGGVVVLANIHKKGAPKSVWLGFFDGAGTLVSRKLITDPKFNLDANDITTIDGGDSWAVAITARLISKRARGHDGDMHAAIYILNKKGDERLSRSYVLGGNNEVSSLSAAEFAGGVSGYVATGRFESAVGKSVGWLMRLNEDASLVWQKEYSRGLSAKLSVGLGYGDGDILAFGDVVPANAGSIGAWLMRIDGVSGKIVWQRYYYGENGDHDYVARSLSVNDDGLIGLMMMANVKSGVKMGSDDHVSHEKLSFESKVIPENMSFSQVLTLNPRGITLSGDSYYNGRGVNVLQMIDGRDGARLMAGYSIVPARDIFKKGLGNNPIYDLGDTLSDAAVKNGGGPSLPDAKMTDKALAGLALLKNKMAALDGKTGNGQIEPNTDDLANSKETLSDLTKDAWVIIGEGPDKYKDPCTPRNPVVR